MSLFEETIKDIGDNIASYSKSAWNNFLRQAQSEINGLAEYYLTGYKDVSMLKRNLVYIKSSINIVNGTDGTEDRADFTYYNNGVASTGGNAPTLLARPKEDKREGINDSFKAPSTPKTRDSLGVNNHYTEKGGKSNAYNTGKWENNGHFTYDYASTDLVSRTAQWMQGVVNDQKRKFISERFNNTISRFHTKNDNESLNELKNSVANTAYTDYGLSHGRNLLKTDPNSSEGYDNPYCRVWTWHHQYGQYVKDTIRPLSDNGHTLNNEDFGRDYDWRYFRNRGSRLDKYGSMFDDKERTTGLVNITPVGDGRGNFDISTKKCMFSIENLAWKGHINKLSNDQVGPLGGRIMWFPPYDLKFNEETSASWEKNVFIGRGEPMYTYSNTERSGTLSFKLLIDHPAILDYWEKRGLDTGKTESDISGPNQELLRFFAGCSVLKATQPPTNTPATTEEPQKEEEPATESNSKVIQFFVYYPNNYSGKNDGVNGKISAMDYLAHGIGTQNMWNYSSGEIEEFSVPTNGKINAEGIGDVTGGYEMGKNGVSLVTNTTTDNHIIDVQLDGSEDKTRLMKQFDPKLVKGITGDTSDYHAYRYYYRVDKDTLNQKLVKDISYVDTASYGLNSTGYTESEYYKKTIKDTGSTYSFAEVYAALENNHGNLDSSLYNEDNVKILEEIFTGKKGTIKSIVTKGRASSQANNESESVNQERNKTLAKNRANSINLWLGAKIKNLKITPTIEEWKIDTDTEYKYENSSVLGAKQNRFAFVEIRYTPVDSEDGNQTTVTSENTAVISDEENQYLTQENIKELVKENKTSTNTTANTNSSVSVRKNGNTTIQDKYGGEDVFFKKLESEDPFIFKKISDKIMYFDPVFHSMSPEGFNSRLTFLQQCMRQGPTMGNSETNSKNANNLAFGMAPVCVLRVGDFYNTRIIVNNINISYNDQVTWDLNQEGIGVMPMIADVTLSFNFIGGSELGGPISRLQNALSFNYYANTSVYDDRAETIDDGVLTPWTGNSTVLHSEKT